MKLIKSSLFSLLAAAVLTVILLTRCGDQGTKKADDTVVAAGDTTAAKTDDITAAKRSGCEGYTGKITDPRAEKLVNTCHFISSELIEEWTKRYQKYKKRGKQEKLPDLGTILGDSSSFNSCIIRKIISNEKCIGLRVVYGMSEDNKIHVMIVGINPDYSSLYIKEDDACCKIDGQKMSAAPPPPAGKMGGAEYGQMP